MGRKIDIQNGQIICEVKPNTKTSGRIIVPISWIGKKVIISETNISEILEVKTKKKNITEPIKSVIQTVEKRVKCEHYDSNCNCRLIKLGNNNLGCFGEKGDKCPDEVFD